MQITYCLNLPQIEKKTPAQETEQTQEVITSVSPGIQQFYVIGVLRV